MLPGGIPKPWSFGLGGSYLEGFRMCAEVFLARAVDERGPRFRK